MGKKQSDDLKKQIEEFLEAWNTPDPTDEELRQLPKITEEELEEKFKELDKYIIKRGSNYAERIKKKSTKE